MIRQRLYLPRYRWDVLVFYDTTSRDAGEILGEIESRGADDATLHRAAHNLRGGLTDTGLTYTNARERCTIIALSEASSRAEFANTWFHEVLHAAVHIGDANGLDVHGEAVAYVGGELARAMQPVAARLMCPQCECK